MRVDYQCCICGEDRQGEPIKINGDIVCYNSDCIDEAVRGATKPMRDALRKIQGGPDHGDV